MSLLRPEKPLVSEAIDQESFTTTRSFHAFLPCRAAAVVPDPDFRVRDHPPPPGLDRVVLAEAEPRAAGPAGPGPPWVSGALPGAVHDKRAEWIWGVLADLEAAGLVTLADKGYQGSMYAKIPYRGKNKPASQKEANRAHARLRAPGERANAQLKSWRILRKLRCCPWRAGQLAKAIHVLQTREA